jgi:anti-sigma factor RsiW
MTNRTSDGNDGQAMGRLMPLRSPLRCEAIADLLVVYADDGLEGEEARRVTQHVTQCAACTAEVVDLRAVIQGLREAPALYPEHGEAYWHALATDIAQAVQASEAIRASEEADVPSHVVQLRRRWWQVSAVAGAGLAAAAALLLMIAPTAHRAPEAQPTVADRTTNWFEVPALQLDDDMSAIDTDPMETVDDLDDNELELVDSVLGEDGV